MDPAGVASAGHNGAAASSSLSQKALLEPTLTKTRPCHPSISMLDWMEEEESVRKKKMALEAQAGEESKGQEKPWRSCMRTGSKPSSGCFKEERPSLGWGHGQSFHESSDLLVPQQLHVGQKPHKCLECGKLFNWSFNLLYHQWVHTREWPYSIKQCWMILDPPTAQHGCFWGVSTCPELRMGPVGAAGAILVVLGDPSAGSQGNLEEKEKKTEVWDKERKLEKWLWKRRERQESRQWKKEKKRHLRKRERLWKGRQRQQKCGQQLLGSRKKLQKRKCRDPGNQGFS
ncbi:hypothetical protein DUI87_32194 [Hirundo rustica rustica]|uniref:C2H2-type domain-containing protein n=1 Tax=Hirundo rustica rustica TaxID=333673 RepID=A0A3M0IXD4_HIRRU|nr:hypothetical protein DUI87_32194 [Hirundo rustica rustica]